MKIQFNTGRNIIGSEELRTSLTSIISGELSRFNDHITRLEVHLSDEDSNKNGVNDKRCMIEARLEGLKPIAVTESCRYPGTGSNRSSSKVKVLS